jgi:RimJ/RimL family protein N-acetyltransferase
MAVILKGTNKMIGDINFSNDDEEDTYEIGYDFNEKYTKQGYATEACIAMMNYIFNELNGRRVFAQCNDDNINSIKLLERLGMRREGYFLEDVTFKNDSDNNPIYVNSYLYAILKKEWDLLHTK